jgi:hypothetical protein
VPRWILVSLSCLLAAGSAGAHHLVAAQFDTNHTITVKGRVTRVEWSNPHAHFFVEAQGGNSKTPNWDFELGSPNGLIKRGWTSSSLRPGDIVVVNGHRAKDGSYLVSVEAVNLSNGKAVFTGSAAATK